MSGKLQGIGAINTDTTTNEFCIRQKSTDTICGKCYSHKMLTTFRKSCVPAFQHNSELMKDLIDWDLLPIINQAYFRFNGHGELINLNHYKNIINTLIEKAEESKKKPAKTKYQDGIVFPQTTSKKEKSNKKFI